jgi:hypothetical protein
VIDRAFEEAVRRDPDQTMRWVVLTNGQEGLLRQVPVAVKRYKVEIVLVQDLIHVLEHLWSAACALHPHDAEQREGWLGDGWSD